MSRYTFHPDREYHARGEFKSNCPQCAKEYTIRTQADEDPEYSTLVYILCDCGKTVYFELPVN